MSYFLNYKNGAVTINPYREVTATATDVWDIINAVEKESNEILTASIDLWTKEEIGKIDLGGLTKTEAKDAVFSDLDFLENLEKIGIKLYNYPELREPQHGLIEEYFPS